MDREPKRIEIVYVALHAHWICWVFMKGPGVEGKDQSRHLPAMMVVFERQWGMVIDLGVMAGTMPTWFVFWLSLRRGYMSRVAAY